MNKVDNLKEEAIENTANKCNLSIATVSKIIKAQYNYILHKAANLEEVKIKSFGTWMIKSSKKNEALEELNKLKDGSEKVVTI